MNKSFTLKSILMLVAMFCLAEKAQAADNVWAWYYTEFKAYPTGAGQIYVSEDGKLTDDEITEWVKECEAKKFAFYQINSQDYYFYTKGNDGRICVGLNEATRADEFSDWEPSRDEDGNIILHNAANQTYPWRFYYASTYKDQDQTVAEGLEPLFPINCCYALFSNIGARIAQGHKSLAKEVTWSPIVNSTGEAVTLTATPADERCHFAYWLDEKTGAKYTDNPLNTIANDPTTFVAFFDCDSAVVVNDTNGKWTLWYHPDYCNLNETENGSFEGLKFMTSDFKDEIVDEQRLSYVEAKEIGYGMSGAPILVKVKGEIMALPAPTLNDWYSGTGSFLQWSGDEGIAESEINKSAFYYYLDIENQRFYKAPADMTSIAPKTAYGVLYLDKLNEEFQEAENAPEFIYWSAEAATPAGISQAQIDEAAGNGKIYNLGGMEMVKAGKGIFILNGKKYISK